MDIKINEDNKNKEFEDEYIVIAIDSTDKDYKQRPVDKREMESRKERIFENPHSSKRQKQENYFDEGNRDEHVHDSKALPELVENIIKSNKINRQIIC